MSAATLERLADRVREEGPPLAVRESFDEALSVYGELAVSGPRTADRRDEYAFVVEAVREGYLCHYGTSRILDAPDADLALLAGDLLYAIGIRGLADLADLESTGILSDLITVAAELQAAGRPELAERLWLGQITALACGKDATHAAVLNALASGRKGAPEELDEWTKETATAHGLGRAFDIARNQIDSGPSNF